MDKFEMLVLQGMRTRLERLIATTESSMEMFLERNDGVETPEYYDEAYLYDTLLWILRGDDH